MNYQFDEQSVKRIASTVLTVERLPSGKPDPRPTGRSDPKETIFAKLTEAIDDGFAWEEVYRLADGSWETVEDGRTSGDDDERLAFDLITGTSSVSDDPVILKKAWVKDGDDWNLGWVIFSGASSGVIKVKCVDDYGHGQFTVSVKKLDGGGSVIGDAFDVEIIHHTTTDDIFNVIAGTGIGGVGFIQIGYPAMRSQFMVLGCVDTVGYPQSIDWTYPLGHD